MPAVCTLCQKASQMGQAAALAVVAFQGCYPSLYYCQCACASFTCRSVILPPGAGLMGDFKTAWVTLCSARSMFVAQVRSHAWLL